MGWDVVASGDGYAMLSGGGHTVGFGSVPDYEPPAWPNEHGSKQFHFDLACTDIGATQSRAVELGATVVDPQPGETWRVLIDPERASVLPHRREELGLTPAAPRPA